MNWYQGDISEAIVVSKKKNAVFVVYIEGKDETSTHFTQVVNSKEVAEKLGSDNFVAIRIEANTLPHQQFSQFYQNTPVPSLYFIGKQGTPIEIIKDTTTPQVLCEQLDNILEKAGVSIKTSPAKQTADFLKSESNPSVSSEKPVPSSPSTSSLPPSPEEVKEEKQQQQEKPVEEIKPLEEVKNNESDNKSELSAEEKIERAKQLLEKKREEKQKEEEENERRKEIERRKAGQSVQQLKRWQDEQELKNLMEERQKEKRENQAARDRVLAQIAQDKAERAAKFGTKSSPPTTQQPEESNEKSITSTPPSSSAAAKKVDSHLARIQFRVPDGKSVIHDFQIHDTLAVVYAYISSNIDLPFSNYTLSTTFPKREFTDADTDKTLAELELIPTAVLLILPIVGSSSSNSSITNVGITSLFWTLLAPIFHIFGFLKKFVFGTPVVTTSDRKKREADVPAERTDQVKRRAGETTVIRRQGNIHRLANKNDSDDDNNTWNGNSTQQM